MGVLGSVLDVEDRNSLGNAGVSLFLDMVCIPFYFTTNGVQEVTKEMDGTTTLGRGRGLSLGPLQGKASKGRRRWDDPDNNCT